MAFQDVYFPSQLRHELEEHVDFSNELAANHVGGESINANWSDANVSFNFQLAQQKISDDFEVYQKFVWAMKGRLHSFRVRSKLDYQAKAGQGVFSQLSATTFQLQKLYDFYGVQHRRLITKPVVGKITVSGGVLGSIDYSTGVVTMVSGTPTSWVGLFDVHCRLDSDRVTFTSEGPVLAGIAPVLLVGKKFND